jgi:colanic acid biosynthesis glycosyl transferase WcaI
MRLRVLILTQWFDPEPTFKGLAFARELVKQGFEVTVLTGFPNYPSGRVYPGYRISWHSIEFIDGIPVHRVALYPSHDHSAFGRVLNYASFAASAFIAGIGLSRRVDVVYAYHPPLTVGVVAALLRLFVRKPVVYDVQDLWPDTLRATGMIQGGRLLSIIGWVCRWVYRRLDQIVVLSPGFMRTLIERGVPGQKLDVIYNWADESALANRNAASPPLDLGVGPGRFCVLFAGNMGRAQGLDAVLDAAQLLEQRGSRVSFVLLGGGVDVDRLRERAAAMKLANVAFLPPVSMAQVGAYLDAADALLVHLRKDALFRVTIPSKTQAYMAAGKPLLLAVEGDAAELVARSGGGVIAEPDNPRALAAMADQLATMPKEELEAMGRRGLSYYQEHLSIDRGTRGFARLFRKLAQAHT